MKIKFTKKLILAIASIIILTLQAFGVKFNVPAVNEIISSVLALLVMFGVLTDSGAEKHDDKKDKPDGMEQPPDDGKDKKNEDDSDKKN